MWEISGLRLWQPMPIWVDNTHTDGLIQYKQGSQVLARGSETPLLLVAPCCQPAGQWGKTTPK